MESPCTSLYLRLNVYSFKLIDELIKVSKTSLRKRYDFDTLYVDTLDIINTICLNNKMKINNEHQRRKKFNP